VQVEQSGQGQAARAGKDMHASEKCAKWHRRTCCCWSGGPAPTPAALGDARVLLPVRVLELLGRYEVSGPSGRAIIAGMYAAA
jgi:hypothetical protein